MRICGVVGAIAALLLLATSAYAGDPERRVALVVGIGTYQEVPVLSNPPNDARSIGEALQGLNFDVMVRLNAGKRDLEFALRDFAEKAAEADVALIYFAGHGLQVDGRNYLVPADARLKRAQDTRYDAVELNDFLDAVAEAQKVGIMIVDACRNNPFVDRLSAQSSRNVVQEGLSSIQDTPSGVLVAMATRADSVASDGNGLHSPYADALLRELKEPGVELGLFFRRVSDLVKAATKDRQEPYFAGTISGAQIYLNPKPANSNPVAAAVPLLQVADTAGPTPLAIPAPTDPDPEDHLVVQVVGLPKGGQVRMSDRILIITDPLTVDQLKLVNFVPDRSFTGDAGAFEYVVRDERGGSARGKVDIKLVSGNHSPVVVASESLKASRNRLDISTPTDSDGDPMTITVTSIPTTGKIRDGRTAIAVGDKLDVATLGRLTFDPEESPAGKAGIFRFKVEDKHGGVAESAISVEVVDEIASTPAVNKEIETSSNVSAPEPVPQVRGIAEATPSADEAASPGLAPAPVQPAPADSLPEGLEPVAGSFVAIKDANVRHGPSQSSNLVDRIAKGTVVDVKGRVQGTHWLYVVTESGIKGYVYEDLLKKAELPSDAATQTTCRGLAVKDCSELPPENAPPSPGDQDKIALATPPVGVPPLAGASGDCPDCPAMVTVPAGAFVMGDSNGDTSERPSHRVEIKRSFAIGRTEVTVAQWRACVEAGGCPAISEMRNADEAVPMHNVDWEDAESYVKWLSDKTGKRYRLPSEAEWEYAARGGSNSQYWWGEEIGSGHASCKNCGGSFSKSSPPRVGSFPANPFGVFDMNGGVSEWVADCWNATYEGAPNDGSARTKGNCGRRVLRGGSWLDEHKYITATCRVFYDFDVRYPANGFRVALDLN